MFFKRKKISAAKNYWQVMKMSFRWKYTIFASIVLAIAIAFLWAINIAAVFPVIKVAVEGQSLPGWVQTSIEDTDERIAQKNSEIDSLQKKINGNKQLAKIEQIKARDKILSLEDEIKKEVKSRNKFVAVQPYVEQYIPRDAFTLVGLVMLFLFGCAALRCVLTLFSSLALHRIVGRTENALYFQFYRKALRQDMDVFARKGTMSEVIKVMFTSGIVNSFNIFYGSLLREPVKMIVCLCGAALINWRLVLLTMIVAPIAIWGIAKLSKAIRKSVQAMLSLEGAQAANYEAGFLAAPIVKAYGREFALRKSCRSLLNTLYIKRRKVAIISSLSHPVTEVLGIFILAVGMLGGAWLTLRGETHILGVRICDVPMGPATLITFFAFLIAAVDPLRKMSGIITGIQESFVFADMVIAGLESKPKVRTPANPVEIPHREAAITFENISFAYNGTDKVVEDVNLQINAGETVVFVGPNGCGKTTLVNMIPRFYDPCEGEVRLGDVSLRNVRLSSLRRRISLVTQDTILFDGNVLENIRYGKPNATDQEVYEAAKRAKVHDIILNRLENGYQTEVGLIGGCLSGGQKQRVALARAFIRDPQILLLDEATSQVDLASEKSIYEAIEGYIRGRTVVAITHRLSILELADKIVVMNNGKIVDVGTHLELMDRCQWYQQQFFTEWEEKNKAQAKVA